MSHRAISMPLIAWIAAPCRPKKIEPSYILWMSQSISNGSSPTTHSARPRQILCDSGASMMARATSAEESTSPRPTRPASVWTLTTSVSWLPSQRSLTSGRRKGIGSTCVIFMRRSILDQEDEDKSILCVYLPVRVVVVHDTQRRFVDGAPTLLEQVRQVEPRLVEHGSSHEVVTGAVVADQDIFVQGHDRFPLE